MARPVSTQPNIHFHVTSGCTFEPDGPSSNVYHYFLSDTVSNCSPGAKEPAKAIKTISGSVTDSYSFGGSVGSGAEYEGVGAKMEVSATYEHGKTVEHHETTTVYAQPGQQGALVTQQGYVRHPGKVRVK